MKVKAVTAVPASQKTLCPPGICAPPNHSPPLKWLLFHYSLVSSLPKYPDSTENNLVGGVGGYMSQRGHLRFYLLKKNVFLFIPCSYARHLNIKTMFSLSVKALSFLGFDCANLIFGLLWGRGFIALPGAQSLVALNILWMVIPRWENLASTSVHPGVCQVVSAILTLFRGTSPAHQVPLY